MQKFFSVLWGIMDTFNNALDVAREPMPWPMPLTPPYAAQEYQEWTLTEIPVPLCRGYFRGLQPCKDNYVLKRDGKVWMSLTPMELESHAPHVAAATGQVLCVGLGMGMALYNFAAKADVQHITVIENDPAVVAMHLNNAHEPEWRQYAHKITIILADAHEGVPPELQGKAFDYAYVDIWERLGDVRAVPDTYAIAKAFNAKAVTWWGMELDFLDYIGARVVKGRIKPTDVIQEAHMQEAVAATKVAVAGIVFTPEYLGALAAVAYHVTNY